MAAGAFSADQLEAAQAAYDRDGFVALRGVFDTSELDALQAECQRLQAAAAPRARTAAGGDGDGGAGPPGAADTITLDDPGAMVDGEPFAHFVNYLTEASPLAAETVRHPRLVSFARRLLGPGAWLMEHDWFGVVYQDARPGPTTGYSRIGWHTDHQSGPHLDMWPSVAFTVHLDPTSPANGFLRVVPGSHRRGLGDIPLHFERVPGEVALYCERGDVLFHHYQLWHAAARATADGDDAVRRHVRGGWYAGKKLAPGHGVRGFVRNADR